jgi:hypothetical protein
VGISYGMQPAAGRLGLDQCRERTNICARFLSSKLIYEVTSCCEATPRILVVFLICARHRRLTVYEINC